MSVFNDTHEIVGGVDTNILNVPWQVSMQTTSGFHFCGGSVIDAEWILTAAHCVVGSSPSSITVKAGITNKNATNQTRSVTNIYTFPGYTSTTSGKDAALLRLSSPLNLADARVAAIPLVTPADEAAGATAAGVPSLVSGWGTLSSGGPSPTTLQSVVVPIVSNAQADALYSTVSITADQLAAGDTSVGGIDACQGDSGGPLVVSVGGVDKVAGIVSWGFGCADAQYPGMYGRVSSFVSWINSTTGGGPPPPPPTDSCEDNCGGNAGSCWCDDACTNFGDCCADYDAICNAPQPGPDTCFGACGTNAGNCWCDSACTNFGDCCTDYTTYCSL
ncbi:MAG: trypsin-like serine protease [Myxococcota bacterium]